MRIGLVVDGETEYYALRPIVSQLRAVTGSDILNPYLANIQPHAPSGQIAQQCATRVKQLVLRGVDLIIVMLDREDRPACCHSIAIEVQAALTPRCPCVVEVVVKDRMFENWVVADPAALAAQPARFDRDQVQRLARQVAPNKADAINALGALKRIVTGSDYDKVADGTRTMERADFSVVASNSRSARRLARLVRHPSYLSQSRNPA